MVTHDTSTWRLEGNFRPWFRGQADAGERPLPSVLRREFDQVRMTLTFQNRAPAFGPTPPQNDLAEWLFLMQHYGLPTRLLDWTESPLIACLFAIEEALTRDPSRKVYESDDMAVWALHPIELNKLEGIDDFELATRRPCRTLENFKFAFGIAGESPEIQPTELPLAVQARHLDLQMAGQQSCFTVQGKDRRDFETMLAATPLVKQGYFRKYVVARSLAPKLLDELDAFGTSYASVYPNFAGMARHLTLRFDGRPSKPVHSPACAPRRQSLTS